MELPRKRAHIGGWLPYLSQSEPGFVWGTYWCDHRPGRPPNISNGVASRGTRSIRLNGGRRREVSFLVAHDARRPDRHRRDRHGCRRIDWGSLSKRPIRREILLGA